MPLKITAIGEVLWDLLPAGRLLGGAPANYSYHAHALGADVRLLTCVGDDPPGRDLLAALRDKGVATDLISVDPNRPTGAVSVKISDRGQPTYTIHEGVAWDYLPVTSQGLQRMAQSDAVCFGSLAQREPVSRQSIRQLIASTPRSCLRIFDINLRAPFYDTAEIVASLELANVLKLNDQELPILRDMLGLSGSDSAVLDAILRRFNLQLIALTRGSEGSLLLSGDARSDHAGIRTEVCDTIGAGDAFTAALTIGLLSKWGLDRINRCASEVARYVCTQPGGTPRLPATLGALFNSL